MYKPGGTYKDGVIEDIKNYKYAQTGSVIGHGCKIRNIKNNKIYIVKENLSKERELYIIKDNVKKHIVW